MKVIVFFKVISKTLKILVLIQELLIFITTLLINMESTLNFCNLRNSSDLNTTDLIPNIKFRMNLQINIKKR